MYRTRKEGGCQCLVLHAASIGFGFLALSSRRWSKTSHNSRLSKAPIPDVRGEGEGERKMANHPEYRQQVRPWKSKVAWRNDTSTGTRRPPGIGMSYTTFRRSPHDGPDSYERNLCVSSCSVRMRGLGRYFFFGRSPSVKAIPGVVALTAAWASNARASCPHRGIPHSKNKLTTLLPPFGLPANNRPAGSNQA
ncbi:hypothetical protein LZ30DRAFT_709095 [Colletotrichum cereale]|nr:hypothetical protein LZ30DRAFT_709095 [Colletotrichum cereale]